MIKKTALIERGQAFLMKNGVTPKDFAAMSEKEQAALMPIEFSYQEYEDFDEAQADLGEDKNGNDVALKLFNEAVKFRARGAASQAVLQGDNLGTSVFRGAKGKLTSEQRQALRDKLAAVAAEFGLEDGSEGEEEVE